MTSVWAVTRGSYSDYHIVAIFTSEEAAERYVGVHSAVEKGSDGVIRVAFLYGPGDYGIEEYDTDPEIDPALAGAMDRVVETVHGKIGLSGYRVRSDPPDLFVGSGPLHPLQAHHEKDVGIVKKRELDAAQPSRTSHSFRRRKIGDRVLADPQWIHPQWILHLDGPDEQTIRRYARDLFARHRAERDTTGYSTLMAELQMTADADES